MPRAIPVYEKLRETIGHEGARLLVEFVEEQVSQRAVTREDLLEVQHGLEGQIQDLRHDLESRINALERRMDRFFSLVLAVMIVLNGDKIVAFLNVLLKLLGP